jgi:hypothetical protein
MTLMRPRLLALAVLVASLGGGAAAIGAAAAAGADAVADFVARHWRAPIPPQGPVPARYSPLEASLQPEACGTCHPSQLADWRTSLHAASMGPGVAGQLVEMLEREPDTALSCHPCHAPLAEQTPRLRGDGGLRPNPAFDATLRAKGVPCAGCHVRGHERFGPPRRDGSLESAAPRETLPHRGVTRTPAFLRAEFCRGCHQFEAGGFALNGKLLEDTYREWQASRFARAGVQCQDCHMPDRRHLWRGIHDPDMVRSGLTIGVEADAERYRPGDTVSATLRVENSGVGHAFPTYVTPLVVLRAELIDAEGRPIAGSREEALIGREVELDLSREIGDTRLSPGQSAALRYRRRVDAAGVRARFSVVVFPDAFYTRFYEALLRQGAGRGAEQIREALAATRRSPFTVFTHELPLT